MTEKTHQTIECQNCGTKWRIIRYNNADIIAELLECPLCEAKP